MKRMMISLLLVASLVSCAPARAYAADLDAEDVAERMVTAVGGQSTYMEADDDMYDYYFGEQAA